MPVDLKRYLTDQNYRRRIAEEEQIATRKSAQESVWQEYEALLFHPGAVKPKKPEIGPCNVNALWMPNFYQRDQ